MIAACDPSRRFARFHRLAAVRIKADIAAPVPSFTRTSCLAPLQAHAKHPHQRIQRHSQIAKVVDLPVQFLFIRTDDTTDSVVPTLSSREMGWIHVEVLLGLPDDIVTEFSRREIDTR
jgi:hypothetical protein